MVKKILPLFPEHLFYVEPFGGGAAVLLNKKPSRNDVYNDLDSRLVNFFRTMRDPELFKEFYTQISLMPYSREEYYAARDRMADAVDFFVVARMSFSGIFGGGWGRAQEATSKSMSMVVGGWLSTIKRLPDFHERLLKVQIENKDWRDILDDYHGKAWLAYLDPPYVLGTRVRKSIYQSEMADDDHRELVEKALDYRGSVVVSGYEHEIYKPLDRKGWTKHNFEAACYAAGCTSKTAELSKPRRIETVWVKDAYAQS